MRNGSTAALRQSQLARLAFMLGLAATVASIGITGCRDSLPVSPTAAVPPEPAQSRFPTEEEYAQMPPEFRDPPNILSYWVDAGFIGNQAYGSASMRYRANYAKIALPIVLLYNNSEVTKTTGITEQTHYLPMIRDIQASATLGVSGSCGHRINATGLFNIHNQFPLGKGWFAWGAQGVSGGATAAQPACSCSDTRRVHEAGYDPYSRDQGESACDGSGGTSGGSGTQYQPGDYTGGEQVSWNTGMGIGGSSSCGSNARVEYVCIDYWDEARQSWVHWACGYVTTCG